MSLNTGTYTCHAMPSKIKHRQLTVDPHPLRLKLGDHANKSWENTAPRFFFRSPRPILAPTGWVVPQPAATPATQNSSPYPSSSPERTIFLKWLYKETMATAKIKPRWSQEKTHISGF